MEETYPVRPIGVRCICYTCKKGEMLPTGKNNWSVEPVLFGHECNQCEFKNMYPVKYPYIKYVATKEVLN